MIYNFGGLQWFLFGGNRELKGHVTQPRREILFLHLLSAFPDYHIFLMRTLNLVAAVEIHELTNVPSFEPTKVYAVLTQGIHKSTSKLADIVNNKASFPADTIQIPFKAHMDQNKGIQTKYLDITLFTRQQSGKPSKLGNVNVNLAEFVTAQHGEELRFLLDNSKSNAILKLAIRVSSNDGIDQVLPAKHPQRSPLSLSVPMTPVSNSIRCDLPMAKSPTQASHMLDKPQESKTSLMGDTHSLMVEALDQSLGQDSNDMLNRLFNKTYRFTWQLQDHGYDEFTPSECIRDIVAHNGNGWKKNDEGFDMIDIVQTEYWDRVNNSKHHKSTLGVNDEDDEWAEFDYEDAKHEDESEEAGDEDEYYELYNQGGAATKKSFNKRVKPLSEVQVREDLRSWNVHIREEV